jgi:hypothetical protein
MKFKVDTSNTFEICSGQKCRTEGRTDEDYFYIPRRLSTGDNKADFVFSKNTFIGNLEIRAQK